MIDLNRETVFQITRGPQVVNMSYSKLYKLIRYGRVGAGGKRIFLESMEFENGLVTSVEAITRFRHKMNAVDYDESRQPQEGQ